MREKMDRFDCVVAALDRLEELAGNTRFRCGGWPRAEELQAFLSALERENAIPFAVWLLQTAPHPQIPEEQSAKRAADACLQAWFDAEETITDAGEKA